MTPAQLAREARSVAYRQRLSSDLPNKESSIKSYMMERGYRTLRAGRYSFELTDGELTVREVPRVSEGQKRLFQDERLYD
jgi:hypothetical protein